MHRVAGVGLIALVLAAVPVLAQTSSLADLRAQVKSSRTEQLRAARDYKAALERLLTVRENELQRALEQAERTRDLAERGIIARRDVETSERAVADARARIDQTWNEALVAASLIAKVLAYDELASGRRLAPGGEQVTDHLIRYQGRRPWTLSFTQSLEDFFRKSFGRVLPVSAYGQTPMHDKLGFDHRHAVDLAVHPDTAEGHAVMDWLRRAGLSFIAFRGAKAGSATGAHIHVGEPSQRLAAP
jgi:hypothetical protein